jgi:hypothetical protein
MKISMARAVAALSLAALGACKGKPVPLKILSWTPVEKGIAVELESEPGARVSCYPSDEPRADAQGRARVVTKLEPGPRQLRCWAQKDGRDGWDDRDVNIAPVLRIEGSSLSCPPSGCDGRVSWSDRASVAFSRLAAGTVVELGASKQTARGGAMKIEAPVRLRPALADAAIAELTSDDSPLDVEVPIAITLPDGQKIAAVLHGGAGAWLGALAHEASTHGAPVGAHAGARSTLLVGALGPKLVGAAERVRELDRVAIAEWQFDQRDCGDYARVMGDHAKQRVTIKITNQRVRVYDRRAAKLIAERLFYAPALECPHYAKTYMGMVSDRLSTEVDAAPVLAWLATLR